MPDKNIFAPRLTRARELAHLSQRQLALRLGISPRAIGQYEQGENLPSVTILIRIAEILECSTDWLLGLSDDTEEYPAHATTLPDPAAHEDDLLKQEGFAPCPDCGCTARNVLSRPFAWLAWPASGEAPAWPEGFISPVTGDVSALKGYLRVCPECGHAEWTLRPPVLAGS